uniref:Uncharacterized protein n=1 Tax=Ralstonia solanacearum TaxID=305 RepID=A0A0S4TR22_RALSL|nr:protein of unknown function [Ralstonia solanacearum]
MPAHRRRHRQAGSADRGRQRADAGVPGVRGVGEHAAKMRASNPSFNVGSAMNRCCLLNDRVA